MAKKRICALSFPDCNTIQLSLALAVPLVTRSSAQSLARTLTLSLLRTAQLSTSIWNHTSCYLYCIVLRASPLLYADELGHSPLAPYPQSNPALSLSGSSFLQLPGSQLNRSAPKVCPCSALNPCGPLKASLGSPRQGIPSAMRPSSGASAMCPSWVSGLPAPACARLNVKLRRTRVV